MTLMYFFFKVFSNQLKSSSPLKSSPKQCCCNCNSPKKKPSLKTTLANLSLRFLRLGNDIQPSKGGGRKCIPLGWSENPSALSFCATLFSAKPEKSNRVEWKMLRVTFPTLLLPGLHKLINASQHTWDEFFCCQFPVAKCSDFGFLQTSKFNGESFRTN